jgi:hypothetical protein
VTESAHEAFNGYMKTRTTERVEFSVWNGDRLAGFLEDGLLRDGLLSREMRSSLRKAIAMSDEPDASFTHFSRLVDSVVAEADAATETKQLTAARQISISLWMLFVWAREQGNLESSYLASEYALLRVWDLTRELLAQETATSEDMGLVIVELVDLHHQVWREFIEERVLPHAGKLHALSAAVRTASPLDVNLKLFDLMGGVALHGLWLIWADRRSADLPGPPPDRGCDGRIEILADRLCGLVGANPALLTPIADEQVIDITLGFMFLAAHGSRWNDLRAWVAQLVQRVDFAYRSGGRYSCARRGYAELADHPRPDIDGYFEDATQASVLLPTLAFWAAAIGNSRSLSILARLKAETLRHRAVQLWLPDEDSEPGLWRGPEDHGAAFFDVPLGPEGTATLDYVLRECGPDTPFARLTAVEQGFWPLVLLACRHHRLPVPPHFWDALLPWVREQPRRGLGLEFPSPTKAELSYAVSPYLTSVAFVAPEVFGVDWETLKASLPDQGRPKADEET